MQDSPILKWLGPEGQKELERCLPKEKEEKECLLPECTEMTKHNGGYCCAEHCRQHRQQQSQGIYKGKDDEKNT